MQHCTIIKAPASGVCLRQQPRCAPGERVNRTFVLASTLPRLRTVIMPQDMQYSEYESLAPRNRVLVIGGGARSGRRSLLRRMLGESLSLGGSSALFARPTSEHSAGNAEVTAPALLRAESVPHTIETRYYKADVEFVLAPPIVVSSAMTDLGEGVEAVIFVCDATKDAHFDAVQSYAPAILGVCEPDIRFLVFSREDAFASSPDVLEQRLREATEWAVDHNIEVLSASLAAESVDEYDPETRESRGARRVLDGLRSHMWPILSLVEDVQGRGARALRGLASTDASASSVLNGTSGDDEEEESGARVRSTEDCAEAQAVAGPQESHTASSPVTRADASGQSAERSIEDGDRALADALYATLVGSAGADDERDELEEMDKLLAEMMQARRNAAGASDAERRRNAERLALRAASMLGIDPAEDEEDADPLPRNSA